MILKKLGAHLSLWEDVSKRSKKYKHGDCSRRCGRLPHPVLLHRQPLCLGKGG
ncbi:MAG: hypothetical protein ACKPKO_38785, partial [Candidatus Fonsibacter sp.]